VAGGSAEPPRRLPYGVVDLHVHIQPWEQLLPAVRGRMESRPGAAELAALMHRPAAILALMDEAGVERIGMINYVSPDLMGFTPAVNDFAAAIARQAPDRLIPFGSVHPRFTADAGAEVRRLRDLGIRALKVHPPHQLFAANAYLADLPSLAAVYGEAQEHGLPVMIHTGTSVFPGARNRFADPMAADDVAVDFPGLVLILAHAGRPLYMETAVFLARRHPNVHLDISGIPPRRLLAYLPRLPEIADKVLWGTDWPDPGVPGLAENLAAFLSLGLPPAVERKILRGNACRIFGWDD
jgi:predicted TIM-barrel fold metal-dependent hydrolase